MLKLKVFKDYDEMCAYTAEELMAAISKKPDLVLGLPTGSTPLGVYSNLVNSYKSGKVDFSRVTTFNLDEYYPIDKNDPQSYYYFMFNNLFSHINVKKENIHIPDGSAKDSDFEVENYEKMIEEAGGIDIQLLGSGINGHIGFNEPAESLNLKTHKVTLTQSTIEANSRFFNDISEVPKFALTMGVGTIFKARRVIILINGEKKAPVLDAMLSGTVSTNVPATLLALHPDTTVVTDEATMAKTKKG